jgi:hypothetical protein
VKSSLGLAAAAALASLVIATVTTPGQESVTGAGYFRADERQGVWWLIDPSGKPTLSTGVDQIAYEPDRIRGTGPAPYFEAVSKIYPDRNAWDLGALYRLRMWGFNTVGAWSDDELWGHGVPYTVILDFATRSGADWQHGKVADFFDRRFEMTARNLAALACRPRSRDPLLIGYFSDNELRWGPDWRGKENMLQMYLAMPEGAAGRKRATDFLRERYSNDIAKLRQAWSVEAADFEHLLPGSATEAFKADSDAFLELVAARYFEVSAQAIHAADPNHLYLGARLAGRVPDAVLRGARSADVVSVNIYSFDPRPLVEHIYEVTRKPVLITEFAFRAEDSGLPNTQGAGPKVPNQAARAKAYTDYVTRLESLPEAIGYHWFKWADEPKEGRFDGENSNYGLVNIEDQPYDDFIAAVESANAQALRAHERSAAPLPNP